MSAALLRMAGASGTGAVNIYRDGDVVTVVAGCDGVRRTARGDEVRTVGSLSQQYQSVEAFEAERDALFRRWPLAYARIKGRLGLRDDARHAPPLPRSLRYLLPETTSATDKTMARVAGVPRLALVASRGGDW